MRIAKCSLMHLLLKFICKELLSVCFDKTRTKLTKHSNVGHNVGLIGYSLGHIMVVLQHNYNDIN